MHGHIDSGKLRGPRRLDYVARQIEALLDRFNPDSVTYEDYAMGKAKGGQGRLFDIGELGGVLKRTIWLRGIDMHLASPTALKKAITGRGNPGFVRGKKATEAEKKQPMVDAIRRDFGIEVPQYDEADAVGLMLLGEIRCGSSNIPRNAVTSARLAIARKFPELPGKMKSFANIQIR